MLKASGVKDGRPTFFIGLSYANLRRFREQPMDTHIVIRAEDMGLSHDIVIFSGPTEAKMSELIIPNLTPDAKVHISDKLKQ